jgi:hypothetical protein
MTDIDTGAAARAAIDAQHAHGAAQPGVGGTVRAATPMAPPVDKAATEAKAKADAVKKAKAEAKKAEPTKEEIEFVAKAMDFDSLLDWSRPELCGNALAEAKRMILGVRAAARMAAEVKKPAEAVKTGA